MSMNKVKILDCTLRDGGYYNDWDFDYEKAKELIIALNDSGVDIIEVGYKSIEKDQFYGLFKYCTEPALTYLKEYSAAEYAFMIDLKEFLRPDGELNIEGLDSVILDKDQSVFTWVRVASHFATVSKAPEFITYFANKGYKVGFNLMGGSLLSDEQIVKTLKIIEADKPEYFYIADSFGSFYPDEVRRLVTLIKDNYDGKIGIHTHDNQGLAYANTLTAIECGVNIVDCTITGMGRGSGNLLTEQFLLGYAEKSQDAKIKPSALLNVLHSYMLPLKQHYGWGFNYTYMLSGLKNIHPTYGQNVNDNNKYTMSEISGILESIPLNSKEKYSDAVLTNAINSYLKTETTEGELPIPTLNVQSIASKSVLLITGGASLHTFLPFVKALADKEHLQVIECNDTGLFNDNANRIVTILNKVRINEFIKTTKHGQYKAVVTGQNSISQSSLQNIYHQPYKVGTLSLADNEIGIPAYEAGIFSVMIALLAGAENIYLAGFDGYEEEEKNKLMNDFLSEIETRDFGKNVNIVSVTPSKYKSLKQVSVFAYLQ